MGYGRVGAGARRRCGEVAAGGGSVAAGRPLNSAEQQEPRPAVHSAQSVSPSKRMAPKRPQASQVAAGSGWSGGMGGAGVSVAVGISFSFGKGC
jgi:hypothetical protein